MCAGICGLCHVAARCDGHIIKNLNLHIVCIFRNAVDQRSGVRIRTRENAELRSRSALDRPRADVAEHLFSDGRQVAAVEYHLAQVIKTIVTITNIIIQRRRSFDCAAVDRDGIIGFNSATPVFGGIIPVAGKAASVESNAFIRIDTKAFIASACIGNNSAAVHHKVAPLTLDAVALLALSRGVKADREGAGSVYGQRAVAADAAVAAEINAMAESN